MKKKIRTWITGYGMVGKALEKSFLKEKSVELLITKKSDLNQIDQKATNEWVKKNKPDNIIITSALVGGIHYNSRNPASFLYINSMINLNLINAAHENGCKRIIFLGASCMYPKESKQPYNEKSLFDGKIEETNEGYGLSKLIGLKMIDYINKQHNKSHISIIPAASYGENDSYDSSKNHVIPALINKIYDAKINNEKSISLWGSGNAKREFIYVEDMANGIIHILKNYKELSPINLGSNEEVTIKELSKIIKKIIGYKGKINFDNDGPEGINRKILDNSKIRKLNWKPKFSLEDGIKLTYEDFLKRK